MKNDYLRAVTGALLFIEPWDDTELNMDDVVL